MALSGIQIFKMTPKKNCKECGCPTCMAFSMKVAQGAMDISACPYMSDDAMAQLSEATAPPMKTIKVGTGDSEYTLGGETVLYRHEKTFVSKTRYAVSLCSCKAAATGKVLVLGCEDADAAKAALEVCKAGKPILNGANASNYEEMSKLATEAGVVLGVSGANIDELHDTVEAIEKLGNKNLVLDTTEATIKETFATTVQVRRASLKDTDRTFGYPSIVNLAKIAQGDRDMQQALLSLFTMKYGSIIVLEEMGYAEALPVFGLRQNVFTDPQKPMKVEPGIYPLNGADENSICLTTVDFALTYFLVSGELERSGVPVNLVINDAGGLSVLTSWAAGKFSGNSISKFFKENVEDKVKSRKVIIPGKVAVLKGDIESKLPGWEVIVAPLEAVQLVKFMKDLQANGEL